LGERFASLIVNEAVWLPIAMSTALVAIGWLYARTRRRVDSRRLITAMMNLFVGVTLAVMGGGHLLAVMTRQLQGTLGASVWLLYPIGFAVLIPSVLIIRHTAALLRPESEPRHTLRLHGWLAATLVVLGLVNIPLAIPSLLTVGYRLHSRRLAGAALLALAILVNGGLLAGGLMFLASGARTFEEFNAMP